MNINIPPCARYGYPDQRRNEYVLVGHTAVGEGWHPLLKRLDQKLVAILGDKHVLVKVDQIKEKLGGLRIYLWLEETVFSEEERKAAFAAVVEAEEESFRTCEKCGSKEGIATKTSPALWRKTLCAQHAI